MFTSVRTQVISIKSGSSGYLISLVLPSTSGPGRDLSQFPSKRLVMLSLNNAQVVFKIETSGRPAHRWKAGSPADNGVSHSLVSARAADALLFYKNNNCIMWVFPIHIWGGKME